MNIDTVVSGSSMLVKLNGRLDSTNAPKLEREINAKLEGIASLTLDFDELMYVSSAGLRVVLACQKKMNAVKGSMVVKNPNDFVMDIFDVTGLLDILNIEKA